MPYRTNDEVKKGVKGAEGYSDKQVSVFRGAFNAALASKLKAGVSEKEAESYAFAVAHAAAKKVKGKHEGPGSCPECGQEPCICEDVDKFLKDCEETDKEDKDKPVNTNKLEGAQIHLHLGDERYEKTNPEIATLQKSFFKERLELIQMVKEQLAGKKET